MIKKKHNIESNTLNGIILVLVFIFLSITKPVAGELTGTWKVWVNRGDHLSELDQWTFDENNEYRTKGNKTTVACIPSIGGVLERNGQKVKLAYTFNCSTNSFHADWKVYLRERSNEESEQKQFYLYTSRNLKSEFILKRDN